MPPQALAAVATLLALLPHGNRIELQLDRGSAELIWITPSTFHFRRVINGPLHPSAEAAHEPVALTMEDTGGQVRMRSRLVEVTIEKQGVKVSARKLDGTPLLLDLSEARSEAGGVVWERQALPGAAIPELTLSDLDGAGELWFDSIDDLQANRDFRVPFVWAS